MEGRKGRRKEGVKNKKGRADGRKEGRNGILRKK
jgi:hypothetical protein